MKKLIYKSVEREAAACREAFKDSQVGDTVWFCHHGIPIEYLTEPAENRIQFILANKPLEQQAARLHWFRPCNVKLPAELAAASEKWAAADKEWAAAHKEWAAAYKELAAASEKWAAASEKWDAASKKWAAASEKWAAAREKWDAASKKWAAACEKWDAADKEWDAASEKWAAACEKWAPEINALVAQHLPGCPWNGKTLFPN
jgi:hypothetical protein